MKKYSKKEKGIISKYPNASEHLLEQLRNDSEYAQMWLGSLVDDYCVDNDMNELIYNLRPLIEAKYTICDFAKLIEINRVTLYKIFSRKIKPSLDVLRKIFSGLGYELELRAKKV